MILEKIRKVYFCPGARNHELLNLFNDDKIIFEIDERSASFKALGHALGTKEIGAVCTTSGTAVAECLPAMIEAYYSNQRLLLISADRPLRMRESAAPQTINHELVTRGYRKFYKDIKIEDFINFPLDEIEYPAHINVIIENSTEIESKHPNEKIYSWDDFFKFTKTSNSPLFLISHGPPQMRLLTEIFKEKNIPFYAEILSNGHELSTFKNEFELLHRLRRNEFDSIIRIGHTPLSKLWRLMEKMHLPVFSFDPRGKAGLSYGKTMEIEIIDLIQEKIFWQAIGSYSGMQFKELNIPPVEEILIRYPESEPAMIQQLLNMIPTESLIYVGNSLSIRFMELVQNRKFMFLGNRGVNGIDGQVSTAIGVANSTNQKVFCVIGDLTALYDIGAIANAPINLIVVIINNKGGKIFDTMKLSEKMCMNHENNFEEISKAFNKKYQKNTLRLAPDTQVLELFPDHSQTISFLKEFE